MNGEGQILCGSRSKSYEELNWKCYENSTKSDKSWRQSLDRGCLSKCVHGKAFLYSYIRAVTSRQIQRVYRQEEKSQSLEAGHEEINPNETVLELGDNYDENQVVLKIKDPPVSLVIMEDLTEPPQATVDAYFTTRDFFRYLFSSEWSNTICLRVMEGEVLELLQTALVVLENTHRIFAHPTQVFINNRIPAKTMSNDQEIPAQLTWESEEHSDDAVPTNQKLPLPKPYETAQGWQYEKLAVKMIYYEKLSISNVPLNTKRKSNSDNMPNDCKKATNRQPLSLKEYDIKKVRLPKYENCNAAQSIAKLKEEIITLTEQKAASDEAKRLEAEERAREAKAKGGKGGKEKENVPAARPEKEEKPGKSKNQQQLPPQPINPEDVEWIGVDPFLVPEKPPAPPPRHKSTAPKASDKERTSKELSKILLEEAKGEHNLSSRGSLDSKDNKSSVISEKDKQGSDISPHPQPLPGITPGEEKNEKGSNMSMPDGPKEAAGHISPQEGYSFKPYTGSLGFEKDNVLPYDTRTSGRLSKDYGDNIDEEEDEGVQKEIYEPLMTRLKLTGIELNINGLYEPRERNREPLASKLRRAKKLRKEKHDIKTKSIISHVIQNSKNDLISSFKHLALEKERERRIRTAPIVDKFNKSQRKLPLKKHLSPWETYLKDLQECEKDSALNNQLEAGLLRRLEVLKSTPVIRPEKEKEQEKGKRKTGKDAKNKSHNHPFDKNKNTVHCKDSCSSLLSSHCGSDLSNFPSWPYQQYDSCRTTCLKNNMSYNTSPPKGNIDPFSCANYSGAKSTQKSPGHLKSVGPKNQKIAQDKPSVKCLHQRSVRTLKSPSLLSAQEMNNSSMSSLNSKQSSKLFSVLKNDVSKGRAPNKYIFSERYPNRNFSSANSHSLPSDSKIPSNQSLEKEEPNADYSERRGSSLLRISKQSSGRKITNGELESRGDEGLEESGRVSSFSPAPEKPPEMTPSEQLAFRLKCFDCECRCEECIEGYEILMPLRPEDKSELLGSYPIHLGKLRTNFAFLRRKDCQRNELFFKGTDFKGGNAVSDELSINEVGTLLQQLIECMIVRTEIVTSSLGQTFTTVTFTKESPTQNWTHFGNCS